MAEKKPLSTDPPNRKLLFPTVKNVLDFILHTSKMHMIWGDVGTGKTTFASQLVKHSLGSGNKIFYMNTKSTDINAIFSRTFNSADFMDNFDLNIWTISSFDEQRTRIFHWNHLLSRLKQFSQRNHQVGLIVIDEISPLYLVNLAKTAAEEKMNRDFIFILATLNEIIRQYNIPVVLINRFRMNFTSSTQSDSTVSPFGGKILKYWFSCSPDTMGLDLQINRTLQPSILEFQVNNHVFLPNYNKKWQWRLGTNGFH